MEKHTNRILSLTVAAVFLLFAVSGCADLGKDLFSSGNSHGLNSPNGPAGSKGDYPDFAGDKMRLLNGKWVLEAYETGPVKKNTVLEFKTQRNLAGNYILSGISAVNFYEAGYSLSGTNGIQITQLSMTEIGGSAADMEFEQKYFERLNSMNTFAFRKNKLVLQNSRGEEMIFG